MNESTVETSVSSVPGIQDAAAAALAGIQAGDLRTAGTALQELARRNRELLDGGDQAIIDALARQAVLLEALFCRMLLSATKVRHPETAAIALKTAFSSQRALLATLGALHQVRHAQAA